MTDEPISTEHMTAGDLVSILIELPSNTHIVIDWYDGGPAMLCIEKADASNGEIQDQAIWIQACAVR